MTTEPKSDFANVPACSIRNESGIPAERQLDSRRDAQPTLDLFTGWEIGALLFLSLLVVVLLDVLFYSSTLEDAFITFRYADHLAQGYGFGAWNTNGERVEGYTTFLWMILLGSLSSIGFDVRTSSKVLGVASHMALCAVFIATPLFVHRQSSERISAKAYVLAGFILALYLPVAWYATTGMETVTFAALIGFFLISMSSRWSTVLMPMTGIGLILIRPEAVLVVFLGVALKLLQGARHGGKRTAAYYTAACSLLTLAVLVIQRLAIFNDFVPNTYWAKAGGASTTHTIWGLQYVFSWIQSNSLFAFFVLVAAAISIRMVTGKGFAAISPDLVFAQLLIVLWLLYVVRVGGDNFAAFPYWRHFIHIAPLLALLIAFAVVTIFPWHRYMQVLMVFALMVVVNISVLSAHRNQLLDEVAKSLSNYPQFKHNSYNPYFTWIKLFSNEHTLVASSMAGELAYVVDAEHIDILGLNSRHVAKEGTFEPGGLQDSKTDMAWVMSQRPEIIEGYVSASKIIAGEPLETIVANARRKMSIEMIFSPIFQEEYCFVQNGPYAYLDRALFFRKDFAEVHQHVQALMCVPVSETTLSKSRD